VDSDEAEQARVLQILLQEVPLKQAASITASILGIKKNQAYDMALKLQQK
jgi:16S rRNA (cytidine1402-2'-O)-methyltransferase